MLFGAILKFFLEDLSYRFLILYVNEREFVLDSGGRLSVGARATFCARLMEKYTFSIVFREVQWFFNDFQLLSYVY